MKYLYLRATVKTEEPFQLAVRERPSLDSKKLLSLPNETHIFLRRLEDEHIPFYELLDGTYVHSDFVTLTHEEEDWLNWKETHEEELDIILTALDGETTNFQPIVDVTEVPAEIIKRIQNELLEE